MSTGFVKLISRQLRDIADRLDAGTSEISEDQAMDVLSMLTHEPLSKDQACSYLNLSRSRFDELVRLGELPKGRKRRGFKELLWYKDELVRKNK